MVSAVADRKSLAAGIAAGMAALTIAQSASALTPVDIFDDRKAVEKGFNLIYEARDLDLPQATRDGFTQARSSIDETKKRVAESKARIVNSVLPFVKKAYWTEAKEELRRQVGTLRFDLNTLASTKAKEEKKASLAANKAFIKQVETFDLAIRQKKQDKALAAYDAVIAALDAAVKASA